jgi:hypothetical protein
VTDMRETSELQREVAGDGSQIPATAMYRLADETKA